MLHDSEHDSRRPKVQGVWCIKYLECTTPPLA